MAEFDKNGNVWESPRIRRPRLEREYNGTMWHNGESIDTTDLQFRPAIPGGGVIIPDATITNTLEINTDGSINTEVNRFSDGALEQLRTQVGDDIARRTENRIREQIAANIRSEGFRLNPENTDPRDVRVTYKGIDITGNVRWVELVESLSEELIRRSR